MSACVQSELSPSGTVKRLDSVDGDALVGGAVTAAIHGSVGRFKEAIGRKLQVARGVETVDANLRRIPAVLINNENRTKN